MEIDTLLEAIQDFEKKNKKEICPVLEQFLCQVAKTGLPMIPWSQFKEYFMFKLEKVIDDFHASSPEQRGQHDPNVDYVPFEEMKERILKIVDSYNGIPFTIQRLCELLIDPKRNYTGAEKFLMGLEKNVMVVSCLFPTTEKNGASSINRMNGVMFPGSSSLYSDCRNVNRPGPSKLNRPKLKGCQLLSTNGLPDCPVRKGPEELEEHHVSDSSSSEGEIAPNTGRKNKRAEEEEEEEEEEVVEEEKETGHPDGDIHQVKRLKLDENEEVEGESEGKDSSCKSSESSPETADSSKESCGKEHEPGSSCDTPTAFGDHDSSETQVKPSERQNDSSESEDVHSLETGRTEDPPEKPVPSERSTSVEQETGESSSSSSSSDDGVCLLSDKQVPSSSNSSDLSTEGGADGSDCAKTALEPGED